MRLFLTALLPLALLVKSDLEVEDCDSSVTNSMRTELLQSSAVLSIIDTHTHTRTNTDGHKQERSHSHADVQPAGKRSALNKPLYWLHVPKCNAGFARSILALPNMCQSMSEQARSLLMDVSRVEDSILDLLNELNTTFQDECPDDVTDLRKYGVVFGDHSGIQKFYLNSVKGHGLIMLRQPEQRLISGWNFYYHSFPKVLLGRDPYDIQEYATTVSGCATKMLVRDQVDTYFHDEQPTTISACGDPYPISEEESNRAITRLREGFLFVGILEEYDLSVCLLHTMFGGDCTPVELTTGHSTSNTSWYDTSILEGWQDEYDGRLYAEGLKLFHKNLELYGVNDASCQACWAQAGIAA